MTKWTKTPALFDSLGIATSWLCLLHCLGLPLLVLLLPTFAHHDDQAHFLLAGWVLLFAVLSMLPEKNRRKDPKVVALMTMGLCIVLAATFSALPEASEVPLITVGNLLVIAAHHLNRRQRCCQV